METLADGWSPAPELIEPSLIGSWPGGALGQAGDCDRLRDAGQC